MDLLAFALMGASKLEERFIVGSDVVNQPEKGGWRFPKNCRM
jgi:hypothetical protein